MLLFRISFQGHAPFFCESSLKRFISSHAHLLFHLCFRISFCLASEVRKSVCVFHWELVFGQLLTLKIETGKRATFDSGSVCVRNPTESIHLFRIQESRITNETKEKFSKTSRFCSS